MKTLLLRIGCLAFIALVCCQVLAAQDNRGEKPLTSRQKMPGGIVTLYGLDPLTRALCFRDGQEGFQFQNNRWENRCSDLMFSFAGGGVLVVGIEANRVATIIDLGTANELRDRYGYEDADNGGEGFASLTLRGKGLVILKEGNPQERVQPLKEGASLFVEPRPSASASVKLGHIYLVRIVDVKDPNYQQIIKLMVIAYRPDESVTLRWEPL